MNAIRKVAMLILSLTGLVALRVHAAPPDLSARVAEQFRSRGLASLPTDRPLAWYRVPAISPVMRLPADFPADGEPAGNLHLVAAQNEFAPGSFLVFAFADFTGATLTASDLTGPGGVIAAENVDLKVVKIWYQSGGGWHSYFADQTGRMLVPELLLNDETLIRVDPETQDNYLRVDAPDGPHYVWISNPLSVDIPFNSHTEPVADAETLQPFRLDAGAFKQFWVTIKAPGGTAPGRYDGTLTLSAGGHRVAIPISLRVLPFALPEPRTYYDPERTFYTMLYNRPCYADILRENGGDADHAARKLLAIFRNMRDHGMMHPRLEDIPRNPTAASEQVFARHLELMREAGLDTEVLFGGIPAIPDIGFLRAVRGVPLAEQTLYPVYLDRAEAAQRVIRETLGNVTVYGFGWDEPSDGNMISQRLPWRRLHERGVKTYSTGRVSHLDVGGYNVDFVNLSGEVRSRDAVAPWHKMGVRVLNYAGPHTGPENPCFMRRTHGLQLYKANYDGIGNYILDSTRWNDFLGDEINFRGFAMTYGTRDGVIDTLQWEGVREAVDDVRYATLLRQLAHAALAADGIDARYTARRALSWLERLDERTADLNAVRLEMIEWILALMTTEKGQ